VGLVYVAAFAPDGGENLGSILARRPPAPGSKYVRPDKDGFLWIAPDEYHDNFCQDLDATEALIMALTQKPIAARCFDDKSGPPAWRARPCWYQVSANDRMIPPELERWMAERMKPQRTIVLDASHASLASHPAEIVALIEEAMGALTLAPVVTH
jgi:pimeloyl-ACP methyl ester carboxylesterase